MYRIILLMIIGGGALIYSGYNEMVLADKSSEKPVATDLYALENGKKVENCHIKIGSHLAVYPAAIYNYYQKKGETGEPGSSTKVSTTYYPIISKKHDFYKGMVSLKKKAKAMRKKLSQMEWPPLNDFKMLVKTSEFDTIGAIPEKFKSSDGFTGMVINEIESLDSEEKNLLRQSWPNMDFDKVYILEAGRAPATAEKYYGFMGGGGLLVLLGLGVAFMRRD